MAAGYTLPGYYGVIPCPHCGTKDCCSVRPYRGPKGRKFFNLVCINTQKKVTPAQVRLQAERHKLSKYVTHVLGGGWTAHEFTFVSEKNQGHTQVGTYEVHDPDGRPVGSRCNTLADAVQIKEKHR